MSKALVTHRTAFEMSWMRNWAEIVANPKLRDEVIAKAKEDLARPGAMAELKKCYAAVKEANQLPLLTT